VKFHARGLAVAGSALCVLALAAYWAWAAPAAAPGRPASPPPAPTAPVGPAAFHAVSAHKHVLDDAHLQPGQCHIRQTVAGPLPDPACTPGAIDPAVNQSNIRTTICTPGYTATVRPSASDTDKWKKVAQQAYGTTSNGEYDHLISLELGGANATSNLRVEPGKIPNAKDAVENRLHKEVCTGQITLAEAQREIATNWTTAR
jgi:hypothetical protein